MSRIEKFLAQTTRAGLIGAILLASGGCETVVDVNLPEHQPVLVANSFFGPDNIWQVRMYKSKDILDGGPIQTVGNATAQILEHENVVAAFTHIGDGLYLATNDRRPEVGHSYTLRASAPSLEPIEASDYVPIPVPIETVDVDARTTPFKLTIHFSDPADAKNYYQILVLTQSGNDMLPIWIESDDLIFQELDGINGNNALFDDSFISGRRYSLKLRAYPWGISPPPPMSVVLVSLTESHYKYLKSAEFQEDNGDNPFSTPVQVHNNIQNGLGIFAGYSGSTVPLFN